MNSGRLVAIASALISLAALAIAISEFEGIMTVIALFSLVFGLVLTLPLVMLCEDILVLIGSGDVTGISCDYMVWIMVGTPVFVMNGAVAGLLRGEGRPRCPR